MLNFVNHNSLNSYLNNDWIERDMHQIAEESNQFFTSDEWLLNSLAKRCIYDLLYKDLFETNKRLRVLDVGGGMSSFACSKFYSHDYEVLDLFHHDSKESLINIQNHFPSVKFTNNDWQEFEFKNDYDVVIANDIFPNVDQRLDEFIEKFSSHTKEFRLSLTYYNQRRFYKVKRVDADELFFIRPWNGDQLLSVLSPWQETFVNSDINNLIHGKETIFENGRQVCILFLKGDRVDEK